MTVLTSHLDTTCETYAGNRKAQLDVLAQLDEELAKVVAGGGERYMQRHRDRGTASPFGRNADGRHRRCSVGQANELADTGPQQQSREDNGNAHCQHRGRHLRSP